MHLDVEPVAVGKRCCNFDVDILADHQSDAWTEHSIFEDKACEPTTDWRKTH